MSTTNPFIVTKNEILSSDIFDHKKQMLWLMYLQNYVVMVVHIEQIKFKIVNGVILSHV